MIALDSIYHLVEKPVPTEKESCMAKPIFIRDQEGSYVIIGSNAGFNTHPAWFHNLKHKPQVTIQVKDKEFKVNAEVAGPGRRNQLWSRLVELAPFYDNYTKKTSREIPVVILQPIQN